MASGSIMVIYMPNHLNWSTNYRNHAIAIFMRYPCWILIYGRTSVIPHLSENIPGAGSIRGRFVPY